MHADKMAVLVANLQDKEDIAMALQRYPHGIDSLDGEIFTGMFADEIDLDLSSWSGNPPGRVSPAAWAEDLFNRLAGFDSTQHMLSHPFTIVEGDEATTRPEVVAMHFIVLDGERQMHAIGGHYEHRWRRTPAGWKVTAMLLNVRWEMGDRGLFGRAWERSAKRMVRI